MNRIDLKADIHKWGVNMRYLGFLYLAVKDKMKKIIFSEMLVRVLKIDLRKALREKFKSLKQSAEYPLIQFYIDHMNQMLGSRANKYWYSTVKKQIKQKYEINGYR